MTLFDWAIEASRRGFHVFPLLPDSKKPAIRDFPNKASRDESVLEKWWKQWPEANVGISTSKFRDAEFLVVVDVDNKGSKRGSEEIFRLEVSGFDFPETCTQNTTTGGLHFIYKSGSPIKQGVNVIGNGLDIRATGGYIVGAGSILDGKIYKINEAEVTDAPEWLVDRCGTPREKTVNLPVIDTSLINESAASERAIHYLRHFAPESIKGQGGDATALQVALTLKDLGLNPKLCLDLMMEHWFNGSGWSREKLKNKIANAFRYGKDPAGVSAPETDFSPTEEDQSQDKSPIEKMNEKNAFIIVKGHHYILTEKLDPNGRPTVEFTAEASWRKKNASKFIYDAKSKAHPVTELWMRSEKRRSYEGICFKPNGNVPDYYNLWRGFAVEPLPYEQGSAEAKEGFDMFLSHLKENIAAGNEEYRDWITAYLAHGIQKPEVKPLTCMAFIGGKGTGKNAFIDRVGRLFNREHYKVFTGKRFLGGNFNSHLEPLIFCVFDEAFWAGDKEIDGILKSLVTSDRNIIERKGMEPYEVDSYLRIIILTNDDRAVPASSDERRYAVFTVGDGRKQDNAYFEKMRILIDEKGGNRILLHYLLNYRSTANINVIPKTAALLDQKERNLTPLGEYVMECLNQGTISKSSLEKVWHERVPKEVLKDAFYAWLDDTGKMKGHRPSVIAITKDLRKILSTIKTDGKTKGDESYVNCYTFPPLGRAREEFETKLNQKVDWGNI